MTLRETVARRLERGAPGGPIARLCSGVWAASARVARPLQWREGAKVVVVGGPTLGGSGKTPLAIACAEALHDAGVRVAFVGHGYRARPSRARFVCATDALREVGDEALVAAARLSTRGVPVIVARTRQSALDFALEAFDVAVVDGLVQTRPSRANLALMAVDASAPWGSGRCPPEGDLRAPVAVLRSAADRIVVVGTMAGPTITGDRAVVLSSGARLNGRLLGWRALSRLRVGLVAGVARPSRVLALLASHGVRPVVTALGADHVGPSQRDRALRVAPDVWLSTPKWRTHLLPGPAFLGGIPVATLDYRLRLGGSLKDALLRAAGVEKRYREPLVAGLLDR